MFQGTIPTKTLKIVNEVVKEWKVKRIFIGWPVYHGNKIKRSITNFNSEITQNNTKTKITF